MCTYIRVVERLEYIFRNFLPEISRNFLSTYVNQLFPNPALQSNAVK